MSLGDKVSQAKGLLSISEIWEKMGYPEPPARLGISVRSPFRDDGKNGSFHVSRCGKFFKDFGGGGEHKGDAVTFVEIGLGCDRKTAMLQLCQMAGLDVAAGGEMETQKPAERPRPIEVRELPALPKDLGPGEAAWHVALAELRQISVEGVKLAVESRHLQFAASIEIPLNDGRLYKCASPVWVVMDPETECNAQVRRLDGAPWWGKMKALTITGSWAAWPIGLAGLDRGAGVLLCEGGPDFIAGYDLLARGLTELHPVGILGAGQALPGGALPLFRRRDVVIAAHYDKPDPKTGKRAGDVACERWAEQLRGYSKRTFKMRGFTEGQDLNDWVTAGGAEVRADRIR